MSQSLAVRAGTIRKQQLAFWSAVSSIVLLLCTMVSVADAAALLTITTNPNSQTVCSGNSVTFTAAATSPLGTPTVQWQLSTDGGTTFNNIAGATATSLTFTTASGDNGKQYRAVFTDGTNNATSTAATLTIDIGVVITTNPSSATVCGGSPGSLTAAATGTPTPTVQWQLLSGSTWSDIPGATSTTLNYSTTPSFTQTTQQYRAVFTNFCGSVNTTAATITVNTATSITSNPQNTSVCAGSNASFTVAFTGAPTPTVQWQISTNGGASFINIAGGTNPTLTFVTVAAQNSYQFHAVVSNACGTSVISTPATLTVNTTPAVTTNPSSSTVCGGSFATFTAAASGSPAPSVQWQLLLGSTWSDIPSATSTTLNVSTSPFPVQVIQQYRAVFTNSCSSATTTAATLTINSPTTITSNPRNDTVCDGDLASLTVGFTGAPTPTVQWQYSIDSGANFYDLPGDTTATYSFYAYSDRNSYLYRAVLSNACGASVVSNAAGITAYTRTRVTLQPGTVTACAGSSVSFFTAATGLPTPTVQWKKSTNGFNYNDIPGATSTTLTVTATQNASYLAVFTDGCVGSKLSNVANLIVTTPPRITSNPDNITVCPNTSATFTATADDAPVPAVQWQLSTNGGASFANINGATSTTLTFTASAAQNKYQYRAMFTNSCGDTTMSVPATLTLNAPPLITVNPASDTTCAYYSTSLTVAATGTPAPTVQWQQSNGVGPFSDISGATSTTYTFSPSRQQNGWYYRAVVTNSCGTATSTSARLTVNITPTVTSQPQTQSIYAGYGATFTTAATATPAATVKWQKSTDNGLNWQDIASETSTTLTLSNQPGSTAYQYRAVFTNDCGSTPTDAATLNVYQPVVLKDSVMPKFIYSMDHSMKTVTVSQLLTGGKAPQTVLQSITSSDADAGVIPGDVANDIQNAAFGTHDLTFDLRAEADTNGRIYTVIYKVTDSLSVGYDTLYIPALPPLSKAYTSIESSGLTLNDPSPNPLTDTSVFTYTSTSDCASRLSVYSLTGTWLMDIVYNAMGSTNTIRWNGKYPNGTPLPSGTYIIQLKACGGVKVNTVTIHRAAVRGPRGS